MDKTAHVRTARDSISTPSGITKVKFLRTTSLIIRELLNADRAEIDSMKRECALIEKGRLHIHLNTERNKYYYSLYSEEDGSETSLNNDMERIYRLARRDFLQLRIKQTESGCRRFSRLLNSIETACEEDRLRRKLLRYSEADLDLCRILFTEEQNEWIEQPYTPNPYHQNNLRYCTDAAFPVRSKSEGILGSGLECFGLPFRYDDIVRINRRGSSDRPFKDSYFADFKVPNLCGGITVHEHFGALHLNGYGDNALQKISDYTNFDIYEIPGRKVTRDEVTWSLESDILNPVRLHKTLIRILLPGKGL
ncbi:MAG: hypothetical protein II696_05240 [Firmicutes bacterium]|nr:hypothetical protein [Bacillota bacterium]